MMQAKLQGLVVASFAAAHLFALTSRQQRDPQLATDPLNSKGLSDYQSSKSTMIDPIHRFYGCEIFRTRQEAPFLGSYMVIK